MLKPGQVKEISLDHDLDDDEHGTGYVVILWIEKNFFTTPNIFKTPIIKVHSANSSARQKMELGIKSIERKSKIQIQT